jgi:histone H3/H4
MSSKKKSPRKILRDNIQGITKPALQRLAYTAGVTNMSGVIYEELRGVLKAEMENIIRKVIIYLEHARKITIDEFMVAASISPKMWSKDPKAKACEKKRKSPSKVSRSRRKKKSPGVNALMQVRFYQKRHDCLNIPMLPFSRFVREVAQDYKSDIKLTKNALIILQYSMENYLVNLLKKALYNAIHANRVRIEPKDIQLARVYTNKLL